MILLNEDTKCIVQGITGKQGSFHTEQMLNYNTNIVAGLTPGKGGQDFLGVPIFNSMEEAVEEVDINSSIISGEHWDSDLNDGAGGWAPGVTIYVPRGSKSAYEEISNITNDGENTIVEFD